MRTKDSEKNKEKALRYVMHTISTHTGVDLSGKFISSLFNVRVDILSQFVRSGHIQKIAHGKYVLPTQTVQPKSLSNFTNVQLVDELKKRGAWNEVHIATDKEVADELRNRGYVVNAYKEKI